MTNSDWFPADYPEARARFRCAAADAGSRLRSYVNPTVTGRHGEELATDVAVLGSDLPTSVLLITSGTHGVEGFCGSGCQDAFLEQRLYERLPRNAAAVLVHALNPYGYSWHRRVTEDNVDLNRNFIDFAAPLPLAPAYEGLHDALVPASWHGPEREVADAKLREFLRMHGDRALLEAVQPGQYRRPTGLFYGGGGPTWSNKTLTRILGDVLAEGVQTLCVLDLHTGLGKPGDGELIYDGPDGAGLDRAKEWFGEEVKDLASGGAVAAKVKGSMVSSVAAIAEPQVRVMPMVLEFGTVAMHEVLNALRADACCYQVVSPNAADQEAAGQLMRAAFYVETREWKASILARFVDVIERAAVRL